MLKAANEVLGYKIAARDGEIGKAYDFFFDYRSWTVRYLVVDTGAWLSDRRVLLVPQALGHSDWERRTFSVDLTRAQVSESPQIDTDQPLTRWHEEQLHTYYAWAPYWGSSFMAGYMQPAQIVVPEPVPPSEAAEPPPDNGLRSVRDTTGYHVAAADGDIGHVEDLIIDEEGWRIRYVVVDTRNWLPGRKVLVDPRWVRDIDWATRSAGTDLTRDQVRKSPPFDPSAPVNRGYEERFYDYYGRPRYWD